MKTIICPICGYKHSFKISDNNDHEILECKCGTSIDIRWLSRKHPKPFKITVYVYSLPDNIKTTPQGQS